MMEDLAHGGAHHLVKRAAQLEPRVIGRVSSSRAHMRCAARPFSPRDPPAGLLQRGRRRAFPLQLHRLSLVCSGMAVLPMLGGGEGGRGREPQGEQLAVSGVWRGGAREGEGERARGRGRAGEGCAHAAGETVARRCGLARAESSRCTRRRVGELGSWPPFCAATPYSGPGPGKCGVEELASDRGHTFCRPPKRLPGAEGPPEGKKRISAVFSECFREGRLL